MSGVIPARAIITQPFAARQATFVVLAGEALGGQIAERRSTAVAAVGVVVVGGQGVARLVNKDAARFQVVLQEIEDAVISAIAAAAHGVAADVAAPLNTYYPSFGVRVLEVGRF